jgi:hypothetical protein
VRAAGSWAGDKLLGLVDRRENNVIMALRASRDELQNRLSDQAARRLG